jgi:hypothetical protein
MPCKTQAVLVGDGPSFCESGPSPKKGTTVLFLVDVSYDPGILVTDLRSGDGPYVSYDPGIFIDRVVLGYESEEDDDDK